jgi:5-enolpyruvylshikimate-3-phosphate synthase
MSGVGRLANKESDRAKAILEMLTQMGVKAHIEGDVLHVEGHTLAQRLLCHADRGSDLSVGHGSLPVGNGSASEGRCGSSAPGLLKGGAYTSHHDHRMVMALKVASLGADSPITIDDEACVAKSFPQFHELFDSAMVK